MKPTFSALLILNFICSSIAFGQSSQVNITTDGQYRYISSNGIPKTGHGEFPNAGNPNSISEQQYNFRVPLDGQLSGTTTDLGHGLFGVALDGVPFDPGTAEYWNHDPDSGWWYEAMSGKINLGLDMNNAHVQPSGAYHYHGVPKGLVNAMGQPDHPTLTGYAADGFPIYSMYGYSNPKAVSPVKELESSWRLKQGLRPSGPGGNYDGTFVQDWEYAAGSGDLDECNGRTGVTPEYPQGTYYYVLTDSFPFVPRCFKGTPDPSFSKRRPEGGGPGARKMGPGGHRQPPPEAIEACSGHSQNDNCSFQAPDRTVSGSCRDIQGTMACVPARPPV
jgi:hypothetical protein